MDIVLDGKRFFYTRAGGIMAAERLGKLAAVRL
jgi:hypothetical protein